MHALSSGMRLNPEQAQNSPGAVEQQLPARVMAAAALVTRMLIRLDIARAGVGTLDQSSSTELSRSARELGQSYRASGLGPEKAIVHLRRILGDRSEGGQYAQRANRWLSHSLRWILDGYYGPEPT